MNKNKKTFKILLDNFNTDSFTGPQFDANYYVDFKSLIVNDADLDKSYYVYVTFRSLGATYSTNGIRSDKIYLLNIDFNKGNNTIQYTPSTRTNKSISHILPVSVTLERTAATTWTYFDLKDSDQKPKVINNIRSVNTIKLQVIEANTYVVFTPITGQNFVVAPTPPITVTAPDNSKYVCILTLVEV